MRTAFIEELIVLARANPRIFLVVGDLGYSVVEPFAREFPDRFLNAGVAEQNMTGMAAGLASEGYHVFTYSIGNFPTFRCAEQIRNDIAYHNLPVTVVAVGGGVAYGNLGYSHHTIQDYALMRSFPNMLIAAPGDPIEARACLRYLVDHPQPSYFRLGKAGEPVFHKSVPLLQPGKWVRVFKGEKSDRVLLSTGGALATALNWVQMKSYRKFSVFSMPLWGMNLKKNQIPQAKRCVKVVTIEDHFMDGGFGSWFLEALNEKPSGKPIVKTHGLNSMILNKVGSQKNLMEIGGLNQKI
jgi:transketolase